MAERNGSVGGPARRGDGGGGPGSGQQDDRSRVAGDQSHAPVEGAASEGTELTDEHRDAGSAGADEVASADTDSGRPAGSAQASAGTADVLTFPSRGGAVTDDEDEDDLPDLEDLGEDAIDLAQLQADDQLLDALGGTNPDSAGSDDEQGPDLEALLVAWRQDVDSTPIGDLVDTDRAVEAISEGGQRSRRRLRRRHLVPVASAAAVLMITFTGVGLAARDALPGDMLWGVAQVLYTDHARAVQAAASAQGDFRYAEQSWNNKHRDEAREALKRGGQQMQAVDPEHGLADLKATQESLAKRFARERADDESTRSSTATSSSTSSRFVPPPPPSTSQLPPSQPPPQLPPPPMTPTQTTPSSPGPTSSQEPTGSSTPPSDTSDSSGHPPSSTGGATWGSSTGGLFSSR